MHPTSSDPRRYGHRCLENVAGRVPRFRSEPVSEQIGGQTISGYDLNFFYLDFTNTALIRGFRTDVGQLSGIVPGGRSGICGVGAGFSSDYDQFAL